jgi:hypothetical protein
MDHKGNYGSRNSSIVECVFAAAVMFLPRRCLVTIRGTHTDTQAYGRYS